jgi:serpin B
MRLREGLRYHETEDYHAVDLLYGNGAFAMTVLLPRAGRTPAGLLAELNPERWRALTEQFQEREVTLTLPKFRLEYGRTLKDDLAAMGMDIAFGAGADLYRIADVRPDRLFLTRVDQKTFVEVNEEGTEAAAVTAGRGELAESVYVPPPRFYADHPFLFVLRDLRTGAVLFAGRIVDPS